MSPTKKMPTASRKTGQRAQRSSISRTADADSLSVPDTPNIPDELLLTANQKITIRCGESSITLTAAGKIILRGKYIVSRSSGVQRIKGGSVQIN